MTNKELQEILKNYPDDVEIIRYNRYQDMNAYWDGYEKVRSLRCEKLGMYKLLFSNDVVEGLLISI